MSPFCDFHFQFLTSLRAINPYIYSVICLVSVIVFGGAGQLGGGWDVGGKCMR
jgi:hypothetical protein